MIEIAVCIGEVDTHIVTDQVLSFDAIDSLLTRAATTTLQAYNAYSAMDSEYETVAEDDTE
jgi:hypothetical protein